MTPNVGAALESFLRGLIGKAGLEEVIRTADRELESIRFKSDDQRADRVVELARDTAQAQHHLSN